MHADKNGEGACSHLGSLTLNKFIHFFEQALQLHSLGVLQITRANTRTRATPHPHTRSVHASSQS